MRYIVNAIRLFLVVILAYSCTKEGADVAASSGTGKGGSLARFTIVGNYLYLADYSTITVFDISQPGNPINKGFVPVGFGVETIYPFKDKLFIGSIQGMYIYSLANPAQPALLGKALHVRSCDPVVANDTVAYVTLRGNTACGPAEDGLYVYNITDVTAPAQKALLRLSTPNGLGLKDSVVFIARGANGLSAVNVKNTASPKEMYTLNKANYVDVIPVEDLLICYVTTGLIVYDIKDLNNPIELGTLNY
jgi:hypothetical protein